MEKHIETEGWEKEEQAQEAFDVLGKFFMRNCNRIPESMLEACDYVSNYLGDIAMGREIAIDKPEDAFPSLITTLTTKHKKEREEAVKAEGERIKKGMEEWRRGMPMTCSESETFEKAHYRIMGVLEALTRPL